MPEKKYDVVEAVPAEQFELMFGEWTLGHVNERLHGVRRCHQAASGCTARPSRRAISRTALDRSSAHWRSPLGTGSIRLSTAAASRQSRSTSAREIPRSNWGDTTTRSMSLSDVAVPCAHDPKRMARRVSTPCTRRTRRRQLPNLPAPRRPSVRPADPRQPSVCPVQSIAIVTPKVNRGCHGLPDERSGGQQSPERTLPPRHFSAESDPETEHSSRSRLLGRVMLANLPQLGGQ